MKRVALILAAVALSCISASAENNKDYVVRRSVDKTFSDGSRYVGEVNARGEMDGQGVYYFGDSADIYEGEFVRDRFEGKGTLYRQEGDRFIGTFKNDRFVKGTHLLPGRQGLRDEGTFSYKKNSLVLVEGIRYYDGFYYEGPFKNNMPNGEGTTTFINGDVYKGVHNNGWESGSGTMTKADGTVTTGHWQNGTWKNI